MPTPAQELVGLSDKRWQAVQDAVQRALASTAKCRSIIPKGPTMIGEKAVVVPSIGRIRSGTPIGYGDDTIATPITVFSDVTLKDRHNESDAEVIRLIEVAATSVGAQEDKEIVKGKADRPRRGAKYGREALNSILVRPALRDPRSTDDMPAEITIGSGPDPSPEELLIAIGNAVNDLENLARPGRFGLLLHNNLMAILRRPRPGISAPAILEAEVLVGGNDIIGTSALDKPPTMQSDQALEKAADDAEDAKDKAYGVLYRAKQKLNVATNVNEAALQRECDEAEAAHKEATEASAEAESDKERDKIGAILFRLDPPAIDLVHTKLPTVTLLGRGDGMINLKVEEEIVLRILDPKAIKRMKYVQVGAGGSAASTSNGDKTT